MVKKLIWGILLLMVAAAAAMIYFVPRGTDEEPAMVAVNTVRRSARGQGIIEGDAEVVMKFGLPGRIEEVDAPEQKEVDAGHHLAKLNTAAINVQIQQAEAALREAEALLRSKKTPRAPEQVQQAEQRAKQAAEEVKQMAAKLEGLLKPLPPKPPVKADFEEADRAIERARTSLSLEQTNLKQLKAGPSAEKLAVAQAEVELARAELDNAEKMLGEFKPGPGLFAPKEKSRSSLENDVNVARRKLTLAQAKYDEAKRAASPEDIEKATAQITLRQLDLDAALAFRKRLDTPGIAEPPTEAEIKAAEAQLAQAKAREEQARTQVDEYKRGPDQSDIDAASAVKDRRFQDLELLKLQKEAMILRAPFDCYILKRWVESGSTVTGNDPVVTVVDFSKKRVRAEFDVAWLKEIKPKMLVSFGGRAFGKDTFEGRVIQIGKVGSRKILQDDPSVSKGGEVVEVVIEIDEPTSELKKPLFKSIIRPGVRVDAEIIIESRNNVVVAPKSYIAHGTGKGGESIEFVWKVERNTATGKIDSPPVKREVKCGLRDDSYVQIVEGLSEGDLIVKPKPQNR